MENIKGKIETEVVSVDYDEIDPLQDKMDVIFLKHQLIASEEIDLKEAHATEEGYGAFIDILNVALETEPAFFLLDDILVKAAEDVLYHRRFDYNKVLNYNEIINEIIGRFNALKTISPYIRQQQRNAYITWNLDVRQLGTAMSEREFYKILAHDANLIQSLVNGSLDDIEPYYFFASTNFLTTVMPELYQAHPEMVELTMEKLDSSLKKRGFWNWAERDYAKETKKNLQKVKVKGE